MASTQKATSYARKSSDGRLEGIEQRDRHGRVYILSFIILLKIIIVLFIISNVYLGQIING